MGRGGLAKIRDKNNRIRGKAERLKRQAEARGIARKAPATPAPVEA